MAPVKLTDGLPQIYYGVFDCISLLDMLAAYTSNIKTTTDHSGNVLATCTITPTLSFWPFGRFSQRISQTMIADQLSDCHLLSTGVLKDKYG